MLFGATYACPACMLRFARREACPSCGGRVVSLMDRDGRAALRRKPPGSGGMAFTLSRWAPARPWIPIAIGIALTLPALYALLFAPNMLRDLWLVDDRSGGAPRLYTEYRGLSWRGIEILAAGAAGLVLAALATATALAARASTKPATSPPKTLRVHVADDSAGEESNVVTGIARSATLEIESPLGGEPCLVVGLRGQVDGIQVDDADGGDFDIVTPEGRVVMVSLEHARLETHGDEEPIELTVEEAVELEAFLLDRIGQRAREHCKLAETVIAAGDTVSVTGRLAGPALAAAPFRDDPRGRILEGTPEHPLVVRLVKRGARTDDRARLPHPAS